MNPFLATQLAFRFLEQYYQTFDKVKESFFKGVDTEFNIIKFEDLDYNSIFEKYGFEQRDKFKFIAIIYKPFYDMVDLFECQVAEKEIMILNAKDVSKINAKELEQINGYKKLYLKDLKEYNDSYYIKQSSSKKEPKLLIKLNDFYENIMIVENVLRGELLHLSGKEEPIDDIINDLKDLDIELGDYFENEENEEEELIKTNANEKFEILKQIGLLELDFFKKNKYHQNKKYKVLGKILGVGERTAMGLYNNTGKYKIKDDVINKVKDYFLD